MKTTVQIKNLEKEVRELHYILTAGQLEILNRLSSSEPEIDKEITFAEWWDIFYTRYSIGRVSEDTLRSYRLAKKQCFSLNRKLLYEITSHDIQLILDELIKSEKFRSAEILKCNLSVCFGFAINKEKRLATNPVTQTHVPHKYKKTSYPELSPAQKKQADIYCNSKPSNKTEERQQVNKDIMLFLFSTGVRISEAVNAKWSWILSTESILINGTKTEKAIRKNYLPKECVQMLVRRYRTSTSDYIFESNAGTKLSKRNVARAFQSAIKGCPQSFRVSFASDAARGGVPIKSLQSHLGHKREITTLKYYIHANDDDLRNVVSMTRGSSKTLLRDTVSQSSLLKLF